MKLNEYGDFEESPKLLFRPKLYNINGNLHHVTYWDAPGEMNQLKETANYCALNAGVVFVFDLSQRESFERISIWMQAMFITVKNPNPIRS
jgi:hypothetical protein